jgi:hypothetical protein
VLTNSLAGAGNDILRKRQGVEVKKPISGQYKVNLDTGDIYVVGSKATERPNLEIQASLLQWGEGKVKLERWQSDSRRDG